ncbi:putative D-arabinose 1-dehydrogenase [Calycina marina]|uniref:D-arabinose 1-dehydrogenase n=1 Tax=Calycina marina TaxID=1763456 RepID=A0A9P8CGU6_9HELO|nr:putative D-arabinose 1-dehydrogenase [Calycina marina]
MPPTQPALNTILPPLICGTATFNSQFNNDPLSLPTTAIIHRALALGIAAFDTSPYYGPSESLLGDALSHPSNTFTRDAYMLLTKVGRIAADCFDYSPAWVRQSVTRSLQRLHTGYLDVVYCHDVEFVSAAEVLSAVGELRRMRDEEGTVRYVGISGYPVPLLWELAELILRETGEPVDIVQSYAHYTLQNTTLGGEALEKFKGAGVGVITNASVLGMGLLRTVGVPIGGMGDFHPSGQPLRQKVAEAARWTEGKGDRIEVVAIRWALDNWARAGKSVGTKTGLGVSVMGVSNLDELQETMTVWNSVLDGFDIRNGAVGGEMQEWSVTRRKQIKLLK